MSYVYARSAETLSLHLQPHYHTCNHAPPKMATHSPAVINCRSSPHNISHSFHHAPYSSCRVAYSAVSLISSTANLLVRWRGNPGVMNLILVGRCTVYSGVNLALGVGGSKCEPASWWWRKTCVTDCVDLLVHTLFRMHRHDQPVPYMLTLHSTPYAYKPHR